MEQLTGAFAQVAVLYGIAGFLALVNERLVEKFVKPLTKPIEAKWGFAGASAYVAFVTGAIMIWFSGLDLITPVLAAAGVVSPGVFGQIISAAMVGGGSHFMHDIWPNKQ